MPDPQTLAKFEEVVPGSAERIIAKFEEQARHRMEIEKKVIHGDVYRSWAGLGAGFILSLVAIIGGCIVAWQGHAASGATIATAAVASLAAVFIYGMSARIQERGKSQGQLKVS